MKPDISIIIPAYNEIGNVPELYSAMNKYLKQTSINVQVVFVDDGSVDGTFNALKNQVIENANIKIIKLSKNFGAHAALRAGILHADADNCAFYYMDMPEPLANIENYYNELSNGYDLVYSERINYRGSLGSRFFSKLINKYIEKSFPQNGVCCLVFNNKIKVQLNNNIENDSSLFFQLFRLGFNKKAIPTEIIERKKGGSKWSMSKKIKLFIDTFVMFSYAPIRLISIIGIVFALIGLIGALAIIIIKVFNLFQISAGFPTLICLLTAGFGVTNVSLGIIAEYLVRTLDASRNRPTFIVDEIVSKR